MLSQLFNRETGRIYDKEKLEAVQASVIIEATRQFCLTFKKMELPCSPQRVAKTLHSYVETERSFAEFYLPTADHERFAQVSAVLWDNMLGHLRLDMLVPRHGPGITSDRTMGNQKYVWKYWHERLEPYFPVLDSAYSISAFDDGVLEKVAFLSAEQEPPVKVVTVPKTLKGPRIIAMESPCMQYTQQAIRSLLYETIENSDLTSGHVNFRDQTVNQELALMSSLTGQYATIDLKDASDRVPRELALEMFRGNPDLRDAIDACRTNSAVLPNGQVIAPLAKFASMGSALCFPIEAMYFYTICVMALLELQNLPVSHRNAYLVSRDVFVYGDDIMVPTQYAISVIDCLQKYNCKVNAAKTFLSGSFRESCGMDAYAGECVTPTYLRNDVPNNRRQAKELISWVATGNLFYKRGYWRTAQFILHKCEQSLGPLPYVSDVSPALGRVSFLGYRSADRWDGHTQSLQVRAWVPGAVYRSDRIDGYSALQKSFLQPHYHGFTCDIVEVDPLNLERFALYGAVTLQRRGVPAI
jgi:hypothetical protein